MKVPPRLLLRPSHLISLGFGFGLTPVWPGTAGSVAGFALFAALQMTPTPVRAGLYLILFSAGAYCCQRTGTALAEQDHRAIVFDEVIGMSLTLESTPHSAPWWIAAFLLFRLFDVWKPWPINLAHTAKPNGVLVMLDDVLAAGYAAALLVALQVLLPGIVPRQ